MVDYKIIDKSFLKNWNGAQQGTIIWKTLTYFTFNGL